MPYKSLAQERWAHSPAGAAAGFTGDRLAEWDAATKGARLPERAPQALRRATKTAKPKPRSKGLKMPKVGKARKV